MGCGSSAFRKRKAKQGSLDEDEDNDTTGPDGTSAVCGTLLTEIRQKVAGIRNKAAEYSGQLQAQIIQIEQDKATASPDQAACENGVAVKAYAGQVPDSTDPNQTAMLQVEAGDKVEIIVREANGWSYCRRQGSKAPGWVPATAIAEVSTLIADVAAAEYMMEAKKGDTVEVVNRHYSGWAFCREWAPPKEGEPAPGGREGWVPDDYLEDKRSEAILASKWHRLVLEALHRVVGTACDLETVLAQASEEYQAELSMEWMGKCLEFASWLASELQSITEAVSQRENFSPAVAGSYATVKRAYVASGPTELNVEQGDRVFILNADNADWIWCRTTAGESRDGWVPSMLLQVEKEDDGFKTARSTATEAEVELPPWLRVGQEAKWWSRSNNCYYDVRISQVNHSTKELRVEFVMDSSCWKCLRFDHFVGPSSGWLLQPHDEKDQELRSQLPLWVQNGNSASWWSESQMRCMAVTIKDVSFKQRTVYVSFDADQHCRKMVKFHELIDDPKSCPLQADDRAHSWRLAKGGSPQPGSAPGNANAYNLKHTVKMDHLIDDICEDVGDMLGPEAIDPGDGNGKANVVDSDLLSDCSETKNSRGNTLKEALEFMGITSPEVTPEKARSSGDASTKASTSSPRSMQATKQGKKQRKLDAVWGDSASPQKTDEEKPSFGGTAGINLNSSGALRTAALSSSGAAKAPSLEGLKGPRKVLSDEFDEGGTADDEGTPRWGESQAAMPLPGEIPGEFSAPTFGKPAQNSRPTSGTGPTGPPSGVGQSRPASGAGQVKPSFGEAGKPTLGRSGSGAGISSSATSASRLGPLPSIGGAADKKASSGMGGQKSTSSSLLGPTSTLHKGFNSAAASGRTKETSDAYGEQPRLRQEPSMEIVQLGRDAKAPGKIGIQDPSRPTSRASWLGSEVAAAEIKEAAKKADATLEAVTEVCGLGVDSTKKNEDVSMVDYSASDEELMEALGEKPISQKPKQKKKGGERAAENPGVAGVGDARNAEGVMYCTFERELMQQLDMTSLPPSPSDRTPVPPPLPLSIQTPPPPPAGLEEISESPASIIGVRARQPSLESIGHVSGPQPVQGRVSSNSASLETPTIGGGKPSAGLIVGSLVPTSEPDLQQAEARKMSLESVGGPATSKHMGSSDANVRLGATGALPTASAASAGLGEASFGGSAMTAAGTYETQHDDEEITLGLSTGFVGGAPIKKPTAGAWGSSQLGTSEAPESISRGPMQTWQDSDGLDILEAPIGPAIGAWDHKDQLSSTGKLDADLGSLAQAWGREEQPKRPASASSLLRDALRVVVPDTWDSEAEHKMGRPPNVTHLANAWGNIDKAYDAAAAKEIRQFDTQIADHTEKACASIETKCRSLEKKLEMKARACEAKLDTACAQKTRSMCREVVIAAETAKENSRKGHEAKLDLKKHKVSAEKKALQCALGSGSGGIVPAVFLPQVDDLKYLAPADAVAEVLDGAKRLFNAVEVVVLRPPEATATDGAQAWGQQRQTKSKAGVELGPLTQAAARALAKSLEALTSKLHKEQECIKEPDDFLESIARGEENLTKQQKREKAMFDGQQDFNWESATQLRVKEQTSRQEHQRAAVLKRVQRILRRRWRRRRDRDRSQSLGVLASMTQAVQLAEDRMNAIWQEQQARADEEVQEVEKERRRMHSQTQELFSAAMIIKQEKARMTKAYDAETQAQRQKLMRKSLRRVKRLNQDMKDLEVVPDLKQKLSTLLYSLRMLEARLMSECPGCEHEIEPGPLEPSSAHRKELEESDKAFQEHLAEDLAAIHNVHNSKARKAVTVVARELLKAAREKHEAVLNGTKAAIEESMRTAVLADSNAALVHPFAAISSKLAVEALRHEEVAKSDQQDSGFGPRTKRLAAAIGTTLEALKQMQQELLARTPPVQSKPEQDDVEWEATLRVAEQRWQRFCEAHPDADREEVEELQTPRQDPVHEMCAAKGLKEALMLDDLEGFDTPNNGAHASRRDKSRKNFEKPAGPPPSKVTFTPKAMGKPPNGPPVGKVPGKSPKGSKASGKTADKENANKNATELLAQLDQLSKNMDTALGRTGTFAQASSAPPPPPQKAGGRKSQAWG